MRPGSYYERCGAAPGGCRVTGSPVGEPPLTTPRRWTLPPKLGAVRGADIKNYVKHAMQSCDQTGTERNKEGRRGSGRWEGGGPQKHFL